jgi:hypothetical protein
MEQKPVPFGLAELDNFLSRALWLKAFDERAKRKLDSNVQAHFARLYTNAINMLLKDIEDFLTPKQGKSLKGFENSAGSEISVAYDKVDRLPTLPSNIDDDIPS